MRLNGAIFKYAVVLLGLFSLLWLAGCKEQKKAAGPRPTPQVSVVEVKPQKVVLTTELPGRTSPFRIAEIRPQVSGLILKRLFQEGSDIKAGQVLYQIDPATFQAALDTAEAALAKAKANLPAIQMRAERYRVLYKKGSLAKQDYDDAESALRQAQAEIKSWQAQVKTARINLGYCRVTAPISGRIGRSNVTEGAIVTAYQPVALATIQQINPIYVDLPQSTTDLLRLKRHLAKGEIENRKDNHNKVKLVLEDGSSYPEEGSLQFRDVTVDPTTGSVILRVVFPNPQGTLLPGMFVQAIIKEGVMDKGMLVPQQGVSRNFKGQPVALTVDAAGKVQQRILTLDRAQGNKWLVLSGLAAGDRVIVEGMQRVRPGMTVKTVAFAPKDAGKSKAPAKTDKPAAGAK
jgi:membrane fusion protein (multidrug efflux system)